MHLIRHAQGYHNLCVANHVIHDPLLTPYGKQQCSHLQQVFPFNDQIDLIVASPIKRTVYTALLSFENTISNKKMTVITLPELQETSDAPCDTGSDKAELEREFEGQPVDLALVVPGWNVKQGRWAPAAEAIEERCRVARNWLRARSEKDIVVVTHGGYLHYLTDDWSDSGKFAGTYCPVFASEFSTKRSAGTGWANTEFRTYTFDPASGDQASLIETAESKTMRRGTEKPLTDAERRNLTQSRNEKEQTSSSKATDPGLKAKV